jgi:type IV secretion system protein VirB9
MRRCLFILPIALAFASPALAQVQEPAVSDGSRVQAVDYAPGRVVPLRSAPGFELMVEFSADEQVKDVAIGDSTGWQVSVNKEGNRLFLKAVQPGGTTNMTVVTSIRTYNFDLEALGEPSADMPYTLVFRYPRANAEPADAQYVDVSGITRRLSKYRISGNRELRPASISEDGEHTYISWARSEPIPAIYAVDQSGKEVLVNGMMGTDDVYVVDGAPRLLNFRIDRSVASAERVVPRRSR